MYLLYHKSAFAAILATQKFEKFIFLPNRQIINYDNLLSTEKTKRTNFVRPDYGFVGVYAAFYFFFKTNQATISFVTIVLLSCSKSNRAASMT